MNTKVVFFTSMKEGNIDRRVSDIEIRVNAWLEYHNIKIQKAYMSVFEDYPVFWIYLNQLLP